MRKDKLFNEGRWLLKGLEEETGRPIRTRGKQDVQQKLVEEGVIPNSILRNRHPLRDFNGSKKKRGR